MIIRYLTDWALEKICSRNGILSIFWGDFSTRNGAVWSQYLFHWNYSDDLKDILMSYPILQFRYILWSGFFGWKWTHDTRMEIMPQAHYPLSRIHFIGIHHTWDHPLTLTNDQTMKACQRRWGGYLMIISPTILFCILYCTSLNHCWYSTDMIQEIIDKTNRQQERERDVY